jgi:hypothetical protein
MKLKNFIYGGLLSSVVIASCSKKDLQLDPYNALPTETAFNTQQDFTNALRGMYQGFVTAGSYTGGEYLVLADLIADNMTRVAAGRNTGQNYYFWTYTSEATSGLWGNGYGIIRRANGILENVGKLPAGQFRNNAEAEALAVRGFVHFDISRVYSKVFANSNPNSDLGIPYITGTEFTLLPSRPTLKATYDAVIADLTKSFGMINLTNADGGFNRVRLNKAAVAGFLSRVYLHMHDWQKTADWADSSLKYNSNPATLTEFPRIWTDETEAGVLFKVRFTEKDNVSVGVQHQQFSSSGYRSEFVPEFTLWQQYTNNDVRKNAYFETSNYLGAPYNHIIKYAKRPTGRLNVVDVKVIRVAEVLISRAEARYNLGNFTGALADLNTLMSNRYTGHVPVTLTGADLLAEIHRQRRLELFAEFDRLFFLKRMNLPVVRPATGDQANGTGAIPPVSARLLPAGSPKFQLPIPISELNANPNLQP